VRLAQSCSGLNLRLEGIEGSEKERKAQKPGNSTGLGYPT
jgi:hypothetical protein